MTGGQAPGAEGVFVDVQVSGTNSSSSRQRHVDRIGVRGVDLHRLRMANQVPEGLLRSSSRAGTMTTRRSADSRCRCNAVL